MVRYWLQAFLLEVLSGFIVFSLIYIATALNRSWPVQVLYAATAAVDVTGTWVVFNMAVYSYIADVTVVETRTKRMGVLDAVWYLGGPTGTLLGGWLYRRFGYVTVFGTLAFLWLVCLLYVAFVVKESGVTAQALVDGQQLSTCCWGPLDPVCNMMRAACRPYPNHGRLRLLLLLTVKLGVFLAQGHQV